MKNITLKNIVKLIIFYIFMEKYCQLLILCLNYSNSIRKRKCWIKNARMIFYNCWRIMAFWWKLWWNMMLFKVFYQKFLILKTFFVIRKTFIWAIFSSYRVCNLLNLFKLTMVCLNNHFWWVKMLLPLKISNLCLRCISFKMIIRASEIIKASILTLIYPFKISWVCEIFLIVI